MTAPRPTALRNERSKPMPRFTSNEITCTALWNEILETNRRGQLYPDPPSTDVARDERIDVLAAEGFIEARELDGVTGWKVVTDAS